MSQKPEQVKDGKKNTESTEKDSTCGIIMPISAIDSCSEDHWYEVRDIIFDVIREAGFEPKMVSDADDAGIIQKRIIQNLYSNPIVICDVSGKNPNVMFELGIRLAFDKPTIIIKDDKTSYSFDTAPIEHLEYPRDLRFSKIVKFKNYLKDKIIGTIEKTKGDGSDSSFLKNFGPFTVAKIDTTEISKSEYIIEELADIRRQLVNINKNQNIVDINENRINNEHIDSKECSLKIQDAITQILLKIEKGEILDRSLLNNTYELINKCKEYGLLPICFNINHRSCKDRFNAILHNKSFVLTSIKNG